MSAVLLERAGNLAAMNSVLMAAKRGKGGLVMVSGPLGIGKSVLLNAFAEQAGCGIRVLRAGSAPLEKDFALGVIRQLFHRPVRMAGPGQSKSWLSEDAASARLLLDDDPCRAGLCYEGTEERTLLEGLWALTANIAARTPLLILVDDLQWTDLPSLRCLTYLANRVATAPVMIAATVRSGDYYAGPEHLGELVSLAALELVPRPLSEAGSATLTGAVFGDADEAFVAACHETSAGNPMVLTAMLRTLQADGVRPRATSADTVRSVLPSSLRERLLSFLRKQSAVVRALATAITIAGEPTQHVVLAKLADLDESEVRNAERALRVAGLLVTSPSGPWFTHPAARAAADELVPLPRREELHLDAARLLYRYGHPAERIAGQLLGVARPQGAWAIDALRTAAATAGSRGCPEEAVKYLQRALVCCPLDGPERADLLVDLATAERWFDQAAAIRHAVQAVPMLHTAAERAAALLPFAPLALGAAPETVVAQVRQIADELGDPLHLSGAERDLALRLEARLRHPSYEDAFRGDAVGDRLAMLTSQPATSTCAERELLTVLLHEAAHRATMPAARVAMLANHVLAGASTNSDHTHIALPMLASVLITADSTGELVQWLEAALKHANERNALVVYRRLRAQSALVHLHTGDFGPARSAAVEAWEMAAAAPGGASELTAGMLALVAMRTGDLQLATDRLDLDYERCRARFTRPFWWLLDGMVVAELGEFGRAVDYALESARALEQDRWHSHGIIPWKALIAELCLRAGDIDQALEIASEDYWSALAWGAPGPLGRSLRIRADILGGHQGIELLREAVEILGRSECKAELAIAQVRLGRALTATGRHQYAAELVREGMELAAVCSATGLTDHHGHGRSITHPVAGRELTATETKVARYAAGGVTNHDIAQALEVSTRAVEKHLTKVYRKLGIVGRADLAAALADTE